MDLGPNAIYGKKAESLTSFCLSPWKRHLSPPPFMSTSPIFSPAQRKRASPARSRVRPDDVVKSVWRSGIAKKLRRSSRLNEKSANELLDEANMGLRLRLKLHRNKQRRQARLAQKRQREREEEEEEESTTPMQDEEEEEDLAPVQQAEEEGAAPVPPMQEDVLLIEPVAPMQDVAPAEKPVEPTAPMQSEPHANDPMQEDVIEAEVVVEDFEEEAPLPPPPPPQLLVAHPLAGPPLLRTGGRFYYRNDPTPTSYMNTPPQIRRRRLAQVAPVVERPTMQWEVVPTDSSLFVTATPPPPPTLRPLPDVSPSVFWLQRVDNEAYCVRTFHEGKPCFARKGDTSGGLLVQSPDGMYHCDVITDAMGEFYLGECRRLSALPLNSWEKRFLEWVMDHPECEVAYTAVPRQVLCEASVFGSDFGEFEVPWGSSFPRPAYTSYLRSLVKV